MVNLCLNKSNNLRYPSGFTVIVVARGKNDTLWGYNERKGQFVLLGKYNPFNSFSPTKGFLFKPLTVYGGVKPVIVRKVNAGELENISLITAMYDLKTKKYAIYDADQKLLRASISAVQRRILDASLMVEEWQKAYQTKDCVAGISVEWNIEHRCLMKRFLRRNNKNPRILELMSFPCKITND